MQTEGIKDGMVIAPGPCKPLRRCCGEQAAYVSVRVFEQLQVLPF